MTQTQSAARRLLSILVMRAVDAEREIALTAESALRAIQAASNGGDAGAKAVLDALAARIAAEQQEDVGEMETAALPLAYAACAAFGWEVDRTEERIITPRPTRRRAVKGATAAKASGPATVESDGRVTGALRVGQSVKEGDALFPPLFRCALVRDAARPEAEAEPVTVTDGRAAASALRSVLPADLDREIFAVMVLDARRRVLGVNVVSVGTLSASLVHPREVFKVALLLNGAAVIVAHNHPSGDCSPSEEDREVTKRLRRAGEIMGVALLDHVILPSGNVDPRREGSAFFSFREHGLL